MIRKRWVAHIRWALLLFGAMNLAACANLRGVVGADCAPPPAEAAADETTEAPLEKEQPLAEAASAETTEAPLEDAMVGEQPPNPTPETNHRLDVSRLQTADGRLILGSVETIRLDPLGIIYEARIDTGAETSSIDAQNIVLFERDGKRWVRFELQDAGQNDPVVVEKRIRRFVLVSQINNLELDRRPVVRMRLQVGATIETVDISLTNRSRMSFPILLGREFLLDRAVVDVSRSHIQDLQ